MGYLSILPRARKMWLMLHRIISPNFLNYLQKANKIPVLLPYYANFLYLTICTYRQRVMRPFSMIGYLTHSTIPWACEAKFFHDPNFDSPKIVESYWLKNHFLFTICSLKSCEFVTTCFLFQHLGFITELWKEFNTCVHF